MALAILLFAVCLLVEVRRELRAHHRRMAAIRREQRRLAVARRREQAAQLQARGYHLTLSPGLVGEREALLLEDDPWNVLLSQLEDMPPTLTQEDAPR